MDPTNRMNVYRLAQIGGVVDKQPGYLFNGKHTTKWLSLMIGDRSKDFRMETISNRPVTEVFTFINRDFIEFLAKCVRQSEYKHWRMQMKTAVKQNEHELTSLNVPDKLATLATANNYSYTTEDIQQMLEEKRLVWFLLSVLPD